MIDNKFYNLSDDVELISYDNDQEWHDIRKKGIGGSDAGAVMGLNKYTSPLKLFRIKSGAYVDNQEDNVFIKKGKDLESLIFDTYVVLDKELFEYTLMRPRHVFVNKQFPWLQANLDGLAKPNLGEGKPETNIVIEIKWVSEWAESNWDGEEYGGIPASYYAQVQHYMTVTGARKAILYALFDRTWTVKKYIIPYNRSFALRMLTETKQFYENMLSNTEPRLTATLDKDFMPEAVKEAPKTTEVSESMDEHISAYLSLKEDVKRLEKEMDEHYNAAVAGYVSGLRPTELFKMDISVRKRTGFDTKRFAEEHPDVYESYKTVTEYTTTAIKRK